MGAAARYSVQGMSCAGCVASVERAIKTVSGVDEALINLAEQTALVEGEFDHAEIVAAVSQAGYEALELFDEADEAARDLETDKYLRSLWLKALVAGLVGFPLMSFGMAGWLPGFESQVFWFVIAAATLGVLIYSGGQFYSGAISAARHHSANMDTLIALGTGSAWSYSVILLLFPQLIPEMAQHAYFEAAAIILCLINVGAALETRAKRKTGDAIKRLIRLRPKKARVVRNGVEIEISLDEILVGERVRVRPGEQVPVDGVVLEGSTRIDESMLSGEPMPVGKKRGDAVSAGTINGTGSILFRAEKIGGETVLAQIIQLVRSAQASKPAIGRMVDRVAEIFVPTVMIIAIMTFLIWVNAVGHVTPLAIVTTMTVMIIACPCALGLATPISIMVGVGKAAESGVLIRHGDALQAAGRLDTIVLDKTGTVTEGHPSVTNVKVLGDVSEQAMLAIAAGLEQHSEHPLARAILDAYEGEPPEVDQFTNIEGQGVQGRIAELNVLVGNRRLMEGHGIDLDRADSMICEAEWRGQTLVHLASGGSLVGLIGVSDQVKSDSADAIARLKKLGTRVIMLSGDNQATAETIGRQVGIDEVFADVLPQEKAAKIDEIRAAGAAVGMVGDGINDAPALASADVGFAIGSGTDVAIQSADITLMRSSLHGVADAVEISRATVRNIKQNLFGAFVYNTLGIPVAAGILFPLFGVLLNPMVAGGAMAMSSVTVVSNANRLRFFKVASR